MSSKIAVGMSVIEIREVANQVRFNLGFSLTDRITPIKLLDSLSLLWEKYGFDYQALPDNDLLFEKGEEAKTDVTTGIIYFKESVLENASRHKFNRSNFTICHELGHFILHRMLGKLNLSRSANNSLPKIFEDPEWQADTFASEFLMPYEICKDLEPAEIRKHYCVSTSAAENRYRKIHKQDIKSSIAEKA